LIEITSSDHSNSTTKIDFIPKHQSNHNSTSTATMPSASSSRASSEPLKKLARATKSCSVQVSLRLSSSNSHKNRKLTFSPLLGSRIRHLCRETIPRCSEGNVCRRVQGFQGVCASECDLMGGWNDSFTHPINDIRIRWEGNGSRGVDRIKRMNQLNKKYTWEHLIISITRQAPTVQASGLTPILELRQSASNTCLYSG
jgi:hypothetical protein